MSERYLVQQSRLLTVGEQITQQNLMQFQSSNILSTSYKHKIYKQFNVQDCTVQLSTSQCSQFHLNSSSDLTDQNHSIKRVSLGCGQCSLVSQFGLGVEPILDWSPIVTCTLLSQCSFDLNAHCWVHSLILK